MTAVERPPGRLHQVVVTPTGVVRIVQVPEGADAPMARPPLPARAERAFERSLGHGLLHLGAVEIGTPLPPAFAFLRELGRLFLTRLCAVPDLEAERASVAVPVPAAELVRLTAAVPPLLGAERLTAEVLEGLWHELEAAFREAAAEFDGTVQELLRSWSPSWNLVGRVCLHLAENKRDDDYPFAFLATQATRLSGHGTVQHLPLGKAVAQYSETGDRDALLSLLLPVRRAAEGSELVAELLESKALFRPQRWTPSQAHRFLQEVPRLEAAGVVVRVPDWWGAAARPRPKVRVSIGEGAQATLTVDSLLDFSVDVAIDGEPLTAAELEALLSSGEGLVRLRGKWVEADRERLGDVLGRWSEVRRAMREEGLSFHEAMRLLAGAALDGRDQDVDELAADGEWSEVAAGAWLEDALERLVDPSRLDVELPGEDELHATLRPYQETGVRWLWHLHALGLGGCLADDMGLGKTIQVLALLLLLRRGERRGPSLLVVPTSLLANWRAEIERFAPSLRAVVIHPSASPAIDLAPLAGDRATVRALATALGDAEVVITSYGMLRGLPVLAKHRWELVVLDEAQAIKTPSSQQTRAAKALDGAVRLALTGTPVENRLSDLWSIFDYLNPGLLGSEKQFGNFVSKLGRGGAGYGPLRSLVRPYILRRLKTDRRVIADLPDKTEVRAYCGLTRRQAALYERAVRELERALEESALEPDGIRRRGLVLASLMALKQICNHPSQWLGDEAYEPRDSGKFARLGELCREIAERQEKALVFTQFRAMTGPLEAFLAGVFGDRGAVLHGGTPARQRQKLVESFQRDDGPPFFVVSLKAGGTGLNLTAASHVIHFDRWWNPAVERQATDRAYRIGQTQPVLVHKFLCRGTVEERIDELIASKEALSDGVLDAGGEAALTELADEDLLRLVRLDGARAGEED